ncbi:SRPBCC family protein [Streptomyces fructofermentans]|uniref:Polyketide cyclase n=1 Tax=Streptomyces fructofermentans TaxID=152141 RepID=A0A918KEL1_9ACTN|nr:SRPBCC family protein [Streptomyces fructofermentans]GGX58477.1 polyketide cyclase [Streptomyces fructofermentans]
MSRRLRPEGPDFVEASPVRLVFERSLSASPEAVYRALAVDVSEWPEWFPAVTSARSTDAGAGRQVGLRGGVRIRETVLAAEPSRVYTYRVDTMNTPGVRALVEEWRLTPDGTGTRVRWTMAADGTAAFRLLARLGRRGLGRAFRGAVTALDRRLASTRA